MTDPGYKWRVLAHHDNGGITERQYDAKDRVCFDELVVDDWFHMEQMDTRDWHVIIGDHHIDVHIPESGPPTLVAYTVTFDDEDVS